MKILALAAVAVVSLSGSASAAKPDAPGSATRNWLELQRSGAQASHQSQAVPGEIMQKTYERYVKSFTHPIPDQFASQPGSSSGAPGAAGQSGAGMP
ncbi:MAG: DUF3613 domain-containing protein [Betaproteobacteria bacterium]|nr:DUF3613 domain-containing protein [Betaproteobacteria bacterium]